MDVQNGSPDGIALVGPGNVVKEFLSYEGVFTAVGGAAAGEGLLFLQSTARARQNIFAALMEAVKTHSLGQISHALYEVGGEYRRDM